MQRAWRHQCRQIPPQALQPGLRLNQLAPGIRAMIDVKRLRIAALALVLAPLAACSSVPNPLDLVSGGSGNRDTAPTDGRASILSFELTLRGSYAHPTPPPR